MRTLFAVVTLAVMAALASPAEAAKKGKSVTQIGTATVSGVKAGDKTCLPQAGKSASASATGTNLHKVCTAAKNQARANLRGQIPSVCAKYIKSTARCKNG